ncbi:MAG TPA: hypothetical protein VN937_03700 [Blastocatellia bacterium]|nr:hypothetical protein [Blastocatellia bacterium]
MKIFCNSCGTQTNNEVLQEYEQDFYREQYQDMEIEFAHGTWQIIQCSGCETGGFRETWLTSEDIGPLLKLELRSVTRGQMEELYSILLAFFAAKASQVIPQLKERMQEDLLVVAPNSTTAESFLSLIATEVVPDVETVRLCHAVTGALNLTDQDSIH